jgi:hypothetical protein
MAQGCVECSDRRRNRAGCRQGMPPRNRSTPSGGRRFDVRVLVWAPPCAIGDPHLYRQHTCGLRITEDSATNGWVKRDNFRSDRCFPKLLTFLSRSSLSSRSMGCTSVKVQGLLVFHLLVGRPGLDPGPLGLRGTVRWLLCVGLVAYAVCFQGIVLPCVALVSWCCRNMRPVGFGAVI